MQLKKSMWLTKKKDLFACASQENTHIQPISTIVCVNNFSIVACNWYIYKRKYVTKQCDTAFQSNSKKDQLE